MRLNPDPNLPTMPAPTADWLNTLCFRIRESFSGVATQLNNLSEGRISAVTNAYTAAPTTGTWNLGDYIKNSAPSELGGAGSKYTIRGWVCTVAGTPGTWVQDRGLTGN